MRWQIYAPSRALELQALCIFSGILFGVQICSCKITWSSSIYDRIDNTRLTDSYASLWKVTAITCCSRCHSDSSCKSVTYNPGSQECRFSGVNFTSVGSNSEQSDEWATFSESDPCPEPWIVYRQHCYRVVSSQRKWEKSVKKCKMMGSYLTDILDVFENTFVTQIGSDAGIAWLWLGPGNYHSIKPQRWTSGQQVNYTNFFPNEPNNDPEIVDIADCIELNTYDGGQWNDLPCSNAKSSVCKKRHY